MANQTVVTWHVESKFHIIKMSVCKLNKWMAYIFMNSFDMMIQMSFLSKWLLANQTSEWLDIFMNSFDMMIQISFSSKWLLANQTSEWLNIFMNSFYVMIQISFLSKWVIANKAFKAFTFLTCHLEM